ncbi:hypothetical protein D3C76_1016660 [compost metagenome]
MVPEKLPSTPSQGQAKRISAVGGVALRNIRATFQMASATRKPTKPKRIDWASIPTAQIDPSQANRKLHSDNGNACRNSMRLRW